MFQYQCVIPPGEACAAIASLLDEITRSGQASFLAVLKTFGGRASLGLLSFPRLGATLALDFPNRGAETLRLLSRLKRAARSTQPKTVASRLTFSGVPSRDGRNFSNIRTQA